MVLGLIFGFLAGISVIILLAYIKKNQSIGMPLIDANVIFASLLSLTLVLLAIQLYDVAIVLFLINAIFVGYSLFKSPHSILLFKEEKFPSIEREILAEEKEMAAIEPPSKTIAEFKAAKIKKSVLPKKKEIKKKPKKR